MHRTIWFVTVTARLEADHPLFARVAELFDDYRQHYGANPAPGTVADWLRDQVDAGRMRLYAAGPGDRAEGFCSVAIVPASLTLRSVWLLRDLYVDPLARGRGIARALLTRVADEARAEGAHRLSLQTEPTNTRALDVYAKAGFEPVRDVELLNLIL